ncbi:MAG: M3 family metallopeptidase [Legionella sp.]
MLASRLPQFTQLDQVNFVNHLEQILNTNLQTIDSILANTDEFTWDNLIQPLDDGTDALERFWSPFSHLHAVVNSPDLRAAYQACLPKLSAYESAIGQNKSLYHAIQSIDVAKLNNVQKKIRLDMLRDFELSGVALDATNQVRFEAIQTRLTELSNQYENNVLDAAQSYTLHLTDEQRLQGIPEHLLHHAALLAKEKELPGWVFNLEFPCYLALITYAKDRGIREQIYQAFSTRASDQGPSAGQYDNSLIMDEILALRHETAVLLGFDNYAQLSLATKMAVSTEQVLTFLQDLSKQAYQQAKIEFAELRAFADESGELVDLAPWDIAYLSERKKQKHYAISDEELRPYFPLAKVMDGLKIIVSRLYGITLIGRQDVDVWHPDVICYEVIDQDQSIRGYIYLDLFARSHKRGGAWMDVLQSRRRLANGDIQLPIATLTCNFAKAAPNQPPALSHDEVTTLFHEFGHCFHHVLTKVDYLQAAGINGVEWDAVELPSQFFENWCWDTNALQLMTAHVVSGESLPANLLQQLLAAKNFQSAMAMMRQLEFSLFDFRIHQDYNPSIPEFIATILNDVRSQTTVVPIAAYNRFQHSFTHVFSGGYAAGYYSYKWAEVLSSDAFARFEEEGIFNAKTGRDFLQNILEVGGSLTASEAYENFRGRPARVDALLRHNGIGTTS